jgi:2'-5' RNA ligase
VLWAGVQAHEGLSRLQRMVDSALFSAGIAREERKFFPHITLARLGQRTTTNRVMRFIAANNLFESEPFLVDRITLYSSTLHPEGAEHSPLHQVIFSHDDTSLDYTDRKV